MRSDQKKALWIEVRNSNTGERTLQPYAAPIPTTRAQRELFLNQLVPQIFPGAKLRTYGGGVGTFICGALLIEAHYGAVRDDTKLAPLPERQLEPVTDGPGQGSLFAA